MACRVPNILFVVIDSLRPEMLSCYGNKLQTSPNIDLLAARGVLFETAISASTWTFPAMASVFTGTCPTKHGGHDEHVVLDCKYPTMAEIFARHGYDTAAFSGIPYIGPMTRLDRGFNLLSNVRHREVRLTAKLLKAIARLRRRVTGKYYKTHESRVLFGEALNWLRKRWDRSKPFLLYIHSDETHIPLLPPARYRQMFTRLSEQQMRAINQSKLEFLSHAVEMSDQDFEDLQLLACASLRHVDTWLGRCLAHLERTDLLNNTIVVVMADHGDNFGDHDLFHHGLCLYDSLIKVPLIMAHGSRLPQQRVGGLVQTIDLLPTLMRLAGIREPEAEQEFQGRDLMTSAHTGRFAEYVISEQYRPSQGNWPDRMPDFMPEFRDKYDRVLRSIRTKTHKYIWSSNGRHELYDLSSDPREVENIIDRDTKLAAHLQRELDAWLRTINGDARVDAESPDSQVEQDDPEIVQRLMDLGYIE